MLILSNVPSTPVQRPLDRRPLTCCRPPATEHRYYRRDGPKSTPKRPRSGKPFRRRGQQPLLPGRGARGNARPKPGPESCSHTLPGSRCNRTARPRRAARRSQSGKGHSNDRRYSVPPADRKQCSETLCRPSSQPLVVSPIISRARHSGPSETENQPFLIDDQIVSCFRRQAQSCARQRITLRFFLLQAAEFETFKLYLADFDGSAAPLRVARASPARSRHEVRTVQR